MSTYERNSEIWLNVSSLKEIFSKDFTRVMKNIKKVKSLLSVNN